ncbi:MAG: PDZ domain-containing protein, partial [Pararhodobacter sp.]|nr:PDZ domain-containing protein [Pararhodobacter sp.]
SVGHNQFPAVYDQLDGEFTLIPAAMLAEPEPGPEPTPDLHDPCAAALPVWAAIESSASRAALEGFATSYATVCPALAALAQDRLEALQATPAPEPEPEPDTADSETAEVAEADAPVHGLSLRPDTESGTTRGLRIIGIEPGSPAAATDLAVGELIVWQTPAHDERLAQFRAYVDRARDRNQSVLQFRVSRADGNTRTVRVALAVAPAPDPGADAADSETAEAPPAAPPDLGLSLQRETDPRGLPGAPGGLRGLRITGIEPGSPAAATDLALRELIFSAGGERVSTVAQFRAQLERARRLNRSELNVRVRQADGIIRTVRVAFSATSPTQQTGDGPDCDAAQRSWTRLQQQTQLTAGNLRTWLRLYEGCRQTTAVRSRLQAIEAESQTALALSAAGPTLGLELEPFTTNSGLRGLRVAAIEPGSPAAATDLARRDVIIFAGGENVRTRDEFLAQIERARRLERSELHLRVQRADGSTRSVRVALSAASPTQQTGDGPDCDAAQRSWTRLQQTTLLTAGNLRTWLRLYEGCRQTTAVRSRLRQVEENQQQFTLTRAQQHQMRLALYRATNTHSMPAFLPSASTPLPPDEARLLSRYAGQHGISIRNREPNRAVVERLRREPNRPQRMNTPGQSEVQTHRDWRSYRRDGRCRIATEAQSYSSPMMPFIPELGASVDPDGSGSSMGWDLAWPMPFDPGSRVRAEVDGSRFSLRIGERGGLIPPLWQGGPQWDSSISRAMRRGQRIRIIGPNAMTGGQMTLEFSLMGFTAAFNRMASMCNRPGVLSWIR